MDLYHEALRPAGIAHLLALAFLSERGSHGSLSLWRPEQRGHHGAEDLEIANVLARHLRRAAAIARRVQATWTKATLLESAFDRLAVGCVLVDAEGRLILANAAAEAVMRRNQPLRLAHGRVVADTAANRQKWRMLLRRLAPADGAAGGAAVALDTEDGAPLKVLAMPLKPTRCESLGLTPRAPRLGLVVMGEAQPMPDSAAALLGRLFGLTAAEAGLAVALSKGESLQAYALRHGRSLNTVKTHLKATFAKTGARRQADLVRELAALGIFMR